MNVASEHGVEYNRLQVRFAQYQIQRLARRTIFIQSHQVNPFMHPVFKDVYIAYFFLFKIK